jgi:hypothetical protein
MIRSLVNSGTLRGTAAETNTLRRMGRGTFDAGTANTRGRQLQDQQEERGQQALAADQAAGRQIAVAQGAPQVGAGAAGNSTWNPTTGRWETTMRPPDERAAAPLNVVDPETGMKAGDLVHAYQSVRPRSKSDPMSRWLLAEALTKAGNDPEKIRAAQETFGADQPGDPEMAKYYRERLRALGVGVPGEEGARRTEGGGTVGPGARGAAGTGPAAAPAQRPGDKWARK